MSIKTRRVVWVDSLTMFVDHTLKLIGFFGRHAAGSFRKSAAIARDLAFAQFMNKRSDLLDIGLWQLLQLFNHHLDLAHAGLNNSSLLGLIQPCDDPRQKLAV